jgi:hypothetical protein
MVNRCRKNIFDECAGTDKSRLKIRLIIGVENTIEIIESICCCVSIDLSVINSLKQLTIFKMKFHFGCCPLTNISSLSFRLNKDGLKMN